MTFFNINKTPAVFTIQRILNSVFRMQLNIWEPHVWIALKIIKLNITDIKTTRESSSDIGSPDSFVDFERQVLLLVAAQPLWVSSITVQVALDMRFECIKYLLGF